MNQEDINNIIDEISETLGPETVANIADKLTDVKTGISGAFSAISKKDEMLKAEQEKNTKLVETNGKLYIKLSEDLDNNREEQEHQQEQDKPKLSLNKILEKAGNEFE